ncbi:MAG TPA: glycoside hydrolase family 88 protein [Bacteroidota bacterium]|nr:glycoside hydrolase family 88 protein [Bacteroidota bacterium]
MCYIILAALVAISGCAAPQTKDAPDHPLMSRWENITEILSQKIERTVGECLESLSYPRSAAPNERWVTVPIRDWTSGFFPGILWYMHEMTGKKSFEASARRWTEGLAPIQWYTGSHDVGFMVFCSYGNGYRLTRDESYKAVILQTARTLTTRYNPVVGCIRSWDNPKWKFPVIVDNMMNLELLFWASRNGGTKEMYDIAVRHAETTMRNHFRPDGSTYHVLDFDTANGSVISRVTHQGYADGSCWARGQAWAIYGFTMTYRYTRDPRFLETARRAADYFLRRLPSDHVPYWDFDAPNIPDEPRDASAGAIAASALLELSGYMEGSPDRDRYFQRAVSMIEALSVPPFLTAEPSSRGILQHAVGNKPGGGEIGVSLIYGDYYFIESLLRYRRLAAGDVVQEGR